MTKKVAEIVEVVKGQLSIFDAFEETEREIKDPVAEVYKGDYVKIKSLKSVLQEREKLDSENEWFFNEFGGKRGTVTNIHTGKKAISYEVTLDNGKVTWANGDDLIYV
jgi:hypothetical protein